MLQCTFVSCVGSVGMSLRYRNLTLPPVLRPILQHYDKLYHKMLPIGKNGELIVDITYHHGIIQIILLFF